MGEIIVFTNLTLDGVMQGPGSPDEDRRDGFTHGGWAAPYDAMQSSEVGASLPGFDALLLGRRTYESFYAFWPQQTGNPFTEILNNMPKYVASTTLSAPLAWQNSTLLQNDVPEAVTQLKAQTGQTIVVMGSGELAQTLMQHNLIDRYVLLIHPLVLGAGRRLFVDNRAGNNGSENGAGTEATLELVSAQSTPKGVVVATYQPVR